MRNNDPAADDPSSEAEAAWRRSLIDRLAGLEARSQANPRLTGLANQAWHGLNRQPDAGLDAAPGHGRAALLLTADGAGRDGPGHLPAAFGAATYAKIAAGAVLTGAIWIAAYGLVTGNVPDLTRPASKSSPAGATPSTAQVQLSTATVSLTRDQSALPTPPPLADQAGDVEAIPVPGLPTETTASTTPLVDAKAAASDPVEAMPQAGQPEAAANEATPRDKVLAMMTQGAAPDTQPGEATNATAARQVPAANDKSAPASSVQVATVRHRVRTRIVHAQLDNSTDTQSQERMALGVTAPGTTAEILPWAKKKTATVPRTSGQSAFAATTPPKPRSPVRAVKPPTNIFEQVLQGLQGLTKPAN